MISIELNNIFRASVQFAKEHRHEYLTLEHIFLSVLKSEEGNTLLTMIGGNVTNMQEHVETYIKMNNPEMEELGEDGEEHEPYETVTLSHVMNDMVSHINSSGRNEAKIGDLVAAIFTQTKSYAYAVLQAEGISRLDILEVISHNDMEEQREADAVEEDETHPNLAAYTTELVAIAENGKIDPIIGRSSEIDRVMQTLCRRKKNNPLLVGEPGVGKTAIAEGLALQIANDDVPDVLLGSKVYALDLGAMISGTKYRGDFEKRLKGVLTELQSLDRAILFIDEIHTLVGAGATSGGSMDAANLLKPALARGELKCIGATTYAEYRNHLDKDKALSRRFSKIEIDEPSIADTMTILQGIKHKYEEYHQISFSDEALQSAVDLSVKYLHDRFLPDKAMDIIDEVGAHFMLRDKKDVMVTSTDIESSVARMLKLPATVVSTDDTSKLKKLARDIQKKLLDKIRRLIKLFTLLNVRMLDLTKRINPLVHFFLWGQQVWVKQL